MTTISEVLPILATTSRTGKRGGTVVFSVRSNKAGDGWICRATGADEMIPGRCYSKRRVHDHDQALRLFVQGSGY